MLNQWSASRLYEELALVVAAILLSPDQKAQHIVVFTDSENVLDLFNAHRALKLFRKRLNTAVDIMLNSKVDVTVKNLPGKGKLIAEHLSRTNLDLARATLLSLKINPMTLIPPP